MVDLEVAGDRTLSIPPWMRIGQLLSLLFFLELALKISFEEQINKNSSKATVLVHKTPLPPAFLFE